MKKKNTLLIKWMLGILFILMAVAYWTTQQTQSKNQGILPAASNVSSHNNFFQFLANFIGMPTGGHVPASGDSEALSPSTLPSETASNVKATRGAKLTAEQGSNASQQENNSGNNPGNNSGNNSGLNAENNPGNLSEMNSENNSGNNSEINSENNQGANAENNTGNNPASNSESNADQGPGNISENNPGNNSEINSENNPDNNPGNNSGNNSGNNPGNSSGNNSGYSGCVLGCYPGCVPGCDAECNPPTCLLGGVNTSNLPIINPIPSDGDVSQNITQQNQQNDALAQLLATRQALVLPARQQAQASKYQIVNADNIPAPSTNPVPADVEEKVQSKQLTYH